MAGWGPPERQRVPSSVRAAPPGRTTWAVSQVRAPHKDVARRHPRPLSLCLTKGWEGAKRLSRVGWENRPVIQQGGKMVNALTGVENRQVPDDAVDEMSGVRGSQLDLTVAAGASPSARQGGRQVPGRSGPRRSHQRRHLPAMVEPALPTRDLSGIRCWREAAAAMATPHCHDDLEVMMVDGDGPADFQFRERILHLEPGPVIAFWGAFPHTLAQSSSGRVLARLMVPMGLVLSRSLPEPLIASLLAGRVLRADIDAQVVSAHFAQWAVDVRSADTEVRTATMLEIEGWLHRIVPKLASIDGVQAAAVSARSLEAAAAMCRYVMLHFRETLHVADVARAAGLHPQYAMTLFRETIGTTIGDYLTGWRLSEAQRLLVGTSATTSQVAFAAGFGSVSQFYECFTLRCGRTPREYRLAMRRV